MSSPLATDLRVCTELAATIRPCCDPEPSDRDYCAQNFLKTALWRLLQEEQEKKEWDGVRAAVLREMDSNVIGLFDHGFRPSHLPLFKAACLLHPGNWAAIVGLCTTAGMSFRAQQAHVKEVSEWSSVRT